MPDISYIVFNGKRYTLEEYLMLQQQAENNQNTEQDSTPPAQETSHVNPQKEDVSQIVLNGERYNIDDAQATSDLSKLTRSIARIYSAESTYSVGETVFYDSSLYVCIAPITVPEEFDDSHWQSIILSDQIAEKQGYEWGDGLQYDYTTNTVSVDVVDDAIEFEERPISSNGVWKEIGNVAILLGTI